MLISVCAIISIILASCALFLYVALIRSKRHITKLDKELRDLRSAYEEVTEEGERNHISHIQVESIDPVTDLPKMNVFEDRLKQAIHQCSRTRSIFAIIALNVENLTEFGLVGSSESNEAIKEIAHRLQMCIRQVDTLARFADGYFLFLLPHLNRPETAIYVAQRIQDALLQSFKFYDKEINASVSMGIAVYPIDGDTLEELLKSANHAKDEAKQRGANQYLFNQSDIHHLGERELNIAQIVRGPDLFNSMIVQYKPFFNVSSHKPVYLQATPHIHHPKLGMLPYASFMTIAENSGKMMEINKWVLKTALTQLQGWYSEQFSPEYIAIPVSLRQLENPHFIYALTEIKQACPIKGLKIVLEVSDDKSSQNPMYLEKLFSLLNENNIQVAVGVVSLANFAMQKLNKISLNYLKIDSAIIKSITADHNKEDIIMKIIELAKDEDIIVMAEGVDTEKQMQRLSKLGCVMMEGKYFGYLMPTGAILEHET